VPIKSSHSIFPTKLTEFVQFIFIISQYCPTACEANIARLALFAQLEGGGMPLQSLEATTSRDWPQDFLHDNGQIVTWRDILATCCNAS
jgi:hypothetical protein